LLPQHFCDCFSTENPTAVLHNSTISGRIHREFTRDGKARFHRFVHQNAMRDDLVGVIGVLKALRVYLGVKPMPDHGQAPTAGRAR
jgi:hypothetical protein